LEYFVYQRNFCGEFFFDLLVGMRLMSRIPPFTGTANLLSEIPFLEYCEISATCLKYSDAVIVFERLGEGKKNMTMMRDSLKIFYLRSHQLFRSFDNRTCALR